MTTETHAHAEHPGEKPHPQARQYMVIAATLTIITVVEVAIFYTPIRESVVFAPILLTLSAVKFALVVMFYMHLRFDPRLFSALFVAPLLIAAGIIVALLFLFGHFIL
jgi:cytochrome c oxidase subunit 4